MYRLMILAFVLVAAPAAAIVLCTEYPPGPAIQELGRICDVLRADPEVNLPNMPPEECQERFAIRGALEYDYMEKRKALDAAARAALLAHGTAAKLALPLPLSGPTPTATATATATPTATASPSSTPTPIQIP